MAKIKINLIPPDAFTKFSLAEKNAYLQQVASEVAMARGQAFKPLDHQSLSRLRRFYMRRRPGDLDIESTPDPAIRESLMLLSDAIHLGEVKQLIAHELPAVTDDPATMRDAPLDDAQLSLFVPTVHDAPLKDDINLMDVAPFSLGKTIRHGKITYELKDALITIEGGSEVGIVTAYDYDIFIYMVSQLAMAMNDYRRGMAKGLRPSFPPRIFRPSAADLLKFCRRERGGRQYEYLEQSLDRLQATRYKITNLTHNRSRRAAESFPLIGRYRVVSRTAQDKIDEIEIEIPEWVYHGVVAPNETPSILTLNPDYFLITKPIGRFIYRLARKATGLHGHAEYNLDTLYTRSGSPMPFPKFRSSLLELVEATKTQPLPDFDLEVIPGKGGEKLRMAKRTKEIEAAAA